jgi:hypothetical protein
MAAAGGRIVIADVLTVVNSNGHLQARDKAIADVAM